MIPLTGIDNRGAGHTAPNSLGFPARALLKPVNGHRNVLCLPASFIPYTAVLSRGRLPEVDNERIGATPPRVSVAVGYLSGGSSLEAFEHRKLVFLRSPIAFEERGGEDYGPALV
jgi:hypothetical protein